MREIKFRAWDNGEYTYSDDYIGDGHEKVAILLSEFFGLDVEQYTGLKDKNGKEIYEGDIVYLAGLGNLTIEDFGFDLWDAVKSGNADDIGEITGNVHEH